MQALVKRAKQFIVSEDGPTATEYAVMLALIIIVAMAGITLLGAKVNTIFTNVIGGRARPRDARRDSNSGRPVDEAGRLPSIDEGFQLPALRYQPCDRPIADA